MKEVSIQKNSYFYFFYICFVFTLFDMVLY